MACDRWGAVVSFSGVFRAMRDFYISIECEISKNKTRNADTDFSLSTMCVGDSLSGGKYARVAI